MCKEWTLPHWKLYISVWSWNCTCHGEFALYTVQCTVCNVSNVSSAQSAHGATFGLVGPGGRKGILAQEHSHCSCHSPASTCELIWAQPHLTGWANAQRRGCYTILGYIRIGCAVLAWLIPSSGPIMNVSCSKICCIEPSVWRYPKSERNRIRNFFPIPNFSDTESTTF